MGNANRYRHGRRLLVQVPVASATVIEKGDFVCVSGGYAVPPSVLLVDGSEESTEAKAKNALAAAFLGIAETASASGETDDVLVDISLESVYELQQASAAAVSFGDQVTIHSNSSASASYTGTDDSISCAANCDNPIAVIVEEHTSAQGAGTKVKLVPQKVLQGASWARS